MIFTDYHYKEHKLPKGRTFSWRPSVYALITKNRKVLMIQSVCNGMWDLPGGGVKLGNMLTDELKREVFEETGYKIKVKDEIPILLKSKYFYAPDIDKYFQTLVMVFKAVLASDEQQTDHIDFEKEVKEIKWVDIKELDQYRVAPLLLPIFKEIKKNKKKFKPFPPPRPSQNSSRA